MIFFYDAQGRLIKSVPTNVYQGSNKASRVWFLMPTPATNIVNVAFTLPNGEYLKQRIMTNATDGVGIPGYQDEQKQYVNAWYYDLKKDVTSYAGQTTVQFFVTAPPNEQDIDGESESPAVDSAIITVLKGVPPVNLPAPENEYQAIITYVASINSAIADLQETVDSIERLETEELNKKLDKEYPIGQSVYTATTAGVTQMILIGTNSAQPGSIVRRTKANPNDPNDKGGQIFTETANAPKHAIPLEQMEEALDEKVNYTDYATQEVAGLARASASQGIFIGARGDFSIAPASENAITLKQQRFQPIVPNTLDLAVKEGMVNNSLVLTEEEITKVLAWLGASKKLYRHTIRINNHIVFTFDTSSASQYTDEDKSISDLQYALASYGVQGNSYEFIPSSIIAGFYAENGVDNPTYRSIIAITEDYNTGGWFIWWLDGGDQCEAITTLTDEVFEI